MAPLHQSLSGLQPTQTAGEFTLTLDPEWAILRSPHGGYLLLLIVNALNQLQSSTPHPDPTHATAHFLKSPSLDFDNGQVKLRVQTLKKGRGYTYLIAELYQKQALLLTSTLIYSDLPHLPLNDEIGTPSPSNPTLLPLSNSAFAPISPLLTHPEHCRHGPQTKERGRRWSDESIFDHWKAGRFSWREDEQLRQEREDDQEKEGKVLKWGAWYQLDHPKDVISSATLPSVLPLPQTALVLMLCQHRYYADLFSSIPELLPPAERQGPTWYPTISMTMQWFIKLSDLYPTSTSTPRSTGYIVDPRAVGLYSTGKIVLGGRHQQDVEVWTSPTSLDPGAEGEVEGWRKKSMLLCTSTQMALCLPAPGFGPDDVVGGGAKSKL